MAYGVTSASIRRASRAVSPASRAPMKMLTTVASVSHAVMCISSLSVPGSGTRQRKPWKYPPMPGVPSPSPAASADPQKIVLAVRKRWVALVAIEMVHSAPAQLMMMSSHRTMRSIMMSSGRTMVLGPSLLSPDAPCGRYIAFVASAVSRATNLKCSRRPTSARYSPKVMSPARVRSSASFALTSLSFGMTTRPMAASRTTPIHSTSPPIWRLSAPAIVTLMLPVTVCHACNMRLQRATPTTMHVGSSVNMWMVARRVCMQSVSACPFFLGRSSRHLASSGWRSATHCSHSLLGLAARASDSSRSNSSSVHPTSALLKRCAILLDANDPNPSLSSETKITSPAENCCPLSVKSPSRAEMK
eukprot:7391869-Prymnesium_polylepis.2